MFFTLEGENGNSVEFDQLEATDTGKVLPYHKLEIGDAKASGGMIIQQIRPGRRFFKEYAMVLEEDKYLEFLHLVTDNSNNFYIEYENIPSVLDNDDLLSVSQKNKFKVAFSISEIKTTAGATLVYLFDLGIQAVNLV